MANSLLEHLLFYVHVIFSMLNGHRGMWGKMIHRERWFSVQRTPCVWFALLPWLKWKLFFRGCVCFFADFYKKKKSYAEHLFSDNATTGF